MSKLLQEILYSSVISILKCVFVERDCETETRGRTAREAEDEGAAKVMGIALQEEGKGGARNQGG